MMVGRLPLANPSPVFGLAMLLVAMLFAVTWKLKVEWLPLIGLACVTALEHAWHLRLFTVGVAIPALSWYLAFFAVFAAFPFVVRQFQQVKGPWFAAALAGPAQFFLVHQLVKAAWPNEVMGLLRRFCRSCGSRPRRCASAGAGRVSRAHDTTGVVRRQHPVFHHADFSDPI
jgi:hypothetical protein